MVAVLVGAAVAATQAQGLLLLPLLIVAVRRATKVPKACTAGEPLHCLAVIMPVRLALMRTAA